MKHLVLAAVAAASAAACASLGRDGIMADRPVTPAAEASPATAAYLRAAGEGDVFEIASSRIALRRTQDPDVRAYATRLIDHHTATANATLDAARAGRVLPPPATLGPEKRAAVQALERQAGAAFDRLYLDQQVPAHQQALALHAGYAQRGDVAPLRASAGAAAAFVRRHLEEAQTLQARAALIQGR